MNRVIGVLSIVIAIMVAVALHQTPRHIATDEVTIVAGDHAFDAPDTIPAGLTMLRLQNHGSDLHHLALVRLDSGHTTRDFVAALTANGPFPVWATYLGGPNAPIPGMEATATLDLAPGHYLIACLVRSADSASHTMVSHAVKGMLHALIVSGDYRPSPLPRADVTMTLVDYGFKLSQPLVAGKQVIRVRNTATQAHELLLVRVAPGQSLSDLPAWTRTGDGPPPATLVGGVTPISRGVDTNITVDLPPGRYGLICLLADIRDGQPHALHGMMREITVNRFLAVRG
jgi:hypothetical protein